MLYKHLNACYIYFVLYCTYIAVSPERHLLGFCVRLVRPHLAKEKFPLGLIADNFWELVPIEVTMKSTYKTTTETNRGYSGKTRLLIVYNISLSFGAVVDFILSEHCF